mmetsp:Transcript_69144/g.192476  ORF Transcript_69144/g.192476 Transcript_69144/m.192476 type:complete len:207 (-) Transcript_69144:390-1010(-)
MSAFRCPLRPNRKRWRSQRLHLSCRRHRYRHRSRRCFRHRPRHIRRRIRLRPTRLSWLGRGCLRRVCHCHQGTARRLSKIRTRRSHRGRPSCSSPGLGSAVACPRSLGWTCGAIEQGDLSHTSFSCPHGFDRAARATPLRAEHWRQDTVTSRWRRRMGTIQFSRPRRFWTQACSAPPGLRWGVRRTPEAASALAKSIGTGSSEGRR